MKNEYHKDIIDLLLACGRTGMPVREIARHLYNGHYGLFAEDVVFNRIYNQVRNYLWNQSLQKHSPFIHPERGVYAIRQDMAVQLDFITELYKEDKDGEHHTVRSDDGARQLSLF